MRVCNSYLGLICTLPSDVRLTEVLSRHEVCMIDQD